VKKGYEPNMYGEEEPLMEIDDYTDQLQDLKNRNKDIVRFLSFSFSQPKSVLKK